jgi:trehalose 6-phosphate synthase/phosphatase
MRLVVVSNRLPIVIESIATAGDRLETGPTVPAVQIRRGSGGLVSALSPVLRRRGGLWIGWPGSATADETVLRDALASYGRQEGYELVPVTLSPEEVDGFYQGFCNQIVWPLFHDLQTQCNFEPGYWTVYSAVKAKFAQVIEEHVGQDDFVWVHDYHLMGLGRQLVERGLRNPLGFFLHTPFPPPDIFAKLPWRSEVLHGLLHYDLLGFQTPRDRENLLDCMRRLVPEARWRRKQATMECAFSPRATRIGVFPIGIDYESFAQAAASPAVTQRVAVLREQMPDQQIILGLDRLDYTKGIPYRLRAFQLALRRYPELHRKVTLLQVVIPSRETVPEYQELKAQIEQLVTQVNGEFTQPGWVPIHHVFRSLEWEELVSYYRVADVGLVTPLKDGMNLVCKEYCACQVEGDGVLILSEFAGAAVQLHRGAILVNPYDLAHVADAIRRAVTMSRAQRRRPMRALRNNVRREDVYWWVDRFLGACGLDRRPQVEAAGPPEAVAAGTSDEQRKGVTNSE